VAHPTTYQASALSISITVYYRLFEAEVEKVIYGLGLSFLRQVNATAVRWTAKQLAPSYSFSQFIDDIARHVLAACQDIGNHLIDGVARRDMNERNLAFLPRPVDPAT